VTLSEFEWVGLDWRVVRLGANGLESSSVEPAQAY